MEKIVAFNRKYVKYVETENSKATTCFDEYEKGMTMKDYDEFFSKIKTELVPCKEGFGQKLELDDSFNKLSIPKNSKESFLSIWRNIGL